MCTDFPIHLPKGTEGWFVECGQDWFLGKKSNTPSLSD